MAFPLFSRQDQNKKIPVSTLDNKEWITRKLQITCFMSEEEREMKRMTMAEWLREATGTPKTRECSWGTRKPCFAADMWLVCGLFICHTNCQPAAAQTLWRSFQTLCCSLPWVSLCRSVTGPPATSTESDGCNHWLLHACFIRPSWCVVWCRLVMWHQDQLCPRVGGESQSNKYWLLYFYHLITL